MPWQPCPNPGNVDPWAAPPNRDHRTDTVYVSYASGEHGVIFRRTWDQSSGAKTYAKRLLADGELFEPWQTEPR